MYSFVDVMRRSGNLAPASFHGWRGGLFGRALCAGLALVGAALFIPSAQAADDVNFALPWLVSGKYAGYFVAKDKGYYADEGLNVTISRGSGSGDAIKRVAVGESQFALADFASVLLAQANDGSPVKIVAMMTDKSAVAVLYLEEAGIKTPADLKGKTIGRSASGASTNMFPAFLKANDLDRASIKEVVIAPGTYLPAMLSRQVDAVLDQSSYLPRYRKSAAAQGLHIDPFRFGDYGVEIYGNGLVANEKLIASNPDLIRRFIRASIKGTEYALNNIPEAIAIVRKSNPEVEADVGEAELADEKEIALTQRVKENGFGFMDGNLTQKMQAELKDLLGLKNTMTNEQVFTLEFLPEKS